MSGVFLGMCYAERRMQVLDRRVVVPAGEDEFTCIIKQFVVISTVVSQFSFGIVVNVVWGVGSPESPGVINGKGWWYPYE